MEIWRTKAVGTPSRGTFFYDSFISKKAIYFNHFTGLRNFKKRGRMRMAVEGAESLQDKCQQIVNNQGLLQEF